MKQIKLLNALPEVFVQREYIHSEVWLKDICFERGSHYLVEAASGVGKSSLCSYIYGNRCDYRGSIFFDDKDISHFGEHDWVTLRNNNLSMLFQDLRLFSELTALENIRLKNDLTHFKKEASIVALFEELGIADKMNIPVAKLSFGQQQRVAFIRALCQRYDFIFLDEPISHLDSANSEIIAAVVLREATAQGASIIATSIGQNLSLPYDYTLKL